MSRRNGKGKSANVYAFRDLDLMQTIEELADNEGWASTYDLAGSMGFGDDLHPISIRLAWMRRFGMLEFERKERFWRLTDGGLRVMEARLKAAQTRALEAIPREAMVDVMANVTSTYRHADPMLAHMLRREFDYGTRRRQ